MALFFALNILLDCLYPTMAWALTAGPSQPEYSSFEPVATTNMVNEFSGDFTYNLPVVNVPGPNGSGYAMSLSYHSGASAEEEASWVGFGWTLNPGAINRAKQATPDDFDQDDVTHWNKIKRNETVSATFKTRAEIFSTDLQPPTPTPTIRYNNYRGFGNTLNVTAGLSGGLISMNYSVSGEEPYSFSAELNPGALIENIRKMTKINQKLTNNKSFKKTLTEAQRNRREKMVDRAFKAGRAIGHMANTYGFQTWGKEERAFAVSAYSGVSRNYTTTLGLAPTMLHIDLEFGIANTYTYQDYDETTVLKSTGSLYGDTGSGATTTDYFLEKESTYNKRDRLLPIPHQSPDQFMLTGEGLAGSFHVVSPQIIRCAPASVESNTVITTTDADFTIGLNIGVGATFGYGEHKLTMEAFSPVSDYGDTDNGISKFFRFNNDLGGNVIYSNHPENTQKSPHVGSIKSVFMAQTDLDDLKEKPGVSSYIGYSTIGDRQQSSSTPFRFLRSQTRDLKTLNHVDYHSSIDKRIAELYTVNESGNTHVYGLPVFVADDNALSYNVHFSDNNPIIENNHQVWRDAVNQNKVKVGETHTSAYALTHLLTQINTSDYLDRTYDGPSTDDFGGWTKFDYRPAEFYKSTYKDKTDREDKWYRWRLPYTGMFYNKGELSDARDDMGAMQSGKKEIYYLKTIETKTHVAFFITNKTNLSGIEALGRTLPIAGSGEVRTDGVSAVKDAEAAWNKDAIGDKHLEKLERIEVYSKSDINGKPVNTVHFEYYADGSPEVLVKNLPNSSYTSGGIKGGKLTLKKVWFEYQGVVNAKIAPYEFKYEYKDLAAIVNDELETKYDDAVHFADQLILESGSAPQNPNYQSTITNGWGGIFYKGLERTQNMRPWLYQGKMPLSTAPSGYVPYDPAAWQLKQIKLPSGGEILVQYEEHEYQYVQNKRALALVSLISADHDEQDYQINLDDIGVPSSLVERKAYFEVLKEYLNKEKMYFKFLYTLLVDEAAYIDKCNVEYIDGFVTATPQIDLSTGIIKIHIEVPSSTNSKTYALPHKACQSFVTRRRAGMKVPTACNESPEDFQFGNPASMTKQVMQRIGTDFNKILDQNCKQMSSTHSYLRVPTYKAKRAGGTRVKRILMYDKGIEANGEVLYGTEYFYENEDGTSSGVATNEPQVMQDENALVTSIIKRNDPTWKERVMSGAEREDFEGPLGESLLPPPSIGYSRVVTQNIHTGKTGTGFRVSEYLTVRDYPFLCNYTEGDNWKPNPINIPAVFLTIIIDERSVSQAYQFTTNDMHGKTKRIALFGGKYESGSLESTYNKTFEELHEYYKPGDMVKVLQEDGSIKPDYIGREERVSIESRHVEDLLEDMSSQFDMSVGYYPLTFMFSGSGSMNYQLRTLRTTVLTKLVSLTGLTKSVTTKQDGITHVTENRVFGKYTGAPVVTATYDGYDQLTNLPSEATAIHDGSYLDYQVPAYLAYPAKGPKSQNEGMKLDFSPGLPVSSNSITVPSNKIKYFIAGDLLRLTSGSTEFLAHVSAVNTTTNVITLQKSYRSISLTGNITKIEVLSSGYRNELLDEAAHFQTYGKTVEQRPFNAGWLPSSLENVLAANVSIYSDDWSNDDAMEGANSYEKGQKGKWRLSANYVLKDKVNDAVGANTNGGTSLYNKSYNNSGVYSNFTGFSYGNLPSNTKWLRTNLLTKYSPDGNSLEEENSMGIKSSAVFGYNQNLPVAIAKNASYGSVKFLSYEDDESVNQNIVNGIAHTGKKSMLLPANSASLSIPLKLDAHDKSKGILIKFWAKSDLEEELDINRYLRLDFSYNSGGVVLQPTLTKVSKVGEWVLYEASVKGLSTVSYTDFTLTPVYLNDNLFYIDDIRIQPYESEVVCYVYDTKTLRLVASFDDQHFGLLYQYNGEGKLVRKLAETERGTKTISETQYNVPKSFN